MKAGVSTKAITPPVGMRESSVDGRNTGIHDPLFASTLVLDDGENALAIVCLDLLLGSSEFCDEMREQIRHRTGVQHTLINFSQAHSAPGVLNSHGDVDEPDEKEWIEKLKGSILETAEEAHANRIPVSLYAGRAPVQLGFNRRLPDENGVVVMEVNKEGPVVPWVNVLQVRSAVGSPEVRREADGDTLALLFEHACHPVVVYRTSTLTSAGYPGYAVQHIKKELGEGVTAMFAQGCCANINGHPLWAGWPEERAHFEKAAEAGRKLGDAALEAMRDSRKIVADTLNVQSTRLMLPTEELPSMEEWAEACSRLKILDLHAYRSRQELLERIKKTIERGKPPELRFDISAVMLGSEWCLVTMAHEPFCEYELWVDENAPFEQTMVFGDTNGMGTYVGNDANLALGEKGGYEAGSFPSLWAHNVEFLHASLAVGIEGMIKEAITSLWTK